MVEIFGIFDKLHYTGQMSGAIVTVNDKTAFFKLLVL